METKLVNSMQSPNNNPKFQHVSMFIPLAHYNRALMDAIAERDIQTVEDLLYCFRVEDQAATRWQGGDHGS